MWPADTKITVPTDTHTHVLPLQFTYKVLFTVYQTNKDYTERKAFTIIILNESVLYVIFETVLYLQWPCIHFLLIHLSKNTALTW